MKKKGLIALLVTGLVALAVGGWIVQGAKAALTSPGRLIPRPA